MLDIFRAKETGLLAVVVLLGGLLAVFGGSVTIKQRDPATGRVTGQVEVNKFLQRANFDNILKSCSWTAVMAVGATVLIIAGGIDLSVGSIYCLAAVSGAMLLRAFGPTGPWDGASAVWGGIAGVLLTIGVGLACGIANGLMVVLLRVHPFIITLGTMSIFRGIAFVTTRAQAITDYPPAFGEFFRYSAGDLTIVPIVIVVLVVAAGHLFLRHTVPGRQVHAIGGNETASLFSGLPVGRIKVLVFGLGGLAAGIAAVISIGVFGAADSSTGRGYELDVIAAAVVGGASLSGGRGSAIGALLGALVIQLIANGIVILEIDQNYTEIIKGAVIIAAVVLDRMSATLGERRMLRP
ncbi:MAG: ABC transporter permease [Phycisphaerae bacterium]|nr:ABC transporter permease [Phycisphaerae bacterium]